MKIRAHLKHHPLDDKRVALPGVKIRAHLKHHPLDGKRVALPGASIFAHLSVTGVIWNDIYISRPQPKEWTMLAYSF